jgi:hypothetical protein
MVKIIQDAEQKIKLQRKNKIIERSLKDYKTNKAVYDFRGFKPIQDVVKEDKPKRTRKKKDEQVDLAKDEEKD